MNAPTNEPGTLALRTVMLPDAQPLPPEGVHYRGSYTPALDELILRRWRLPLVRRFAHATPPPTSRPACALSTATAWMPCSVRCARPPAAPCCCTSRPAPPSCAAAASAAVAAAPEAAFAALPQPAVAPLGAGTFGVMIAGIGGTGVITVGAVLAMAAHLEGKAASTYDMTGLSQKNRAVYSHLQVAASAAGLGANRLGLGDADLVLGLDMVAAVGDEAFRTIDPSRTRLVGKLGVLPTAMQALDPAARVDFGLLARKVSAKLAPAQVRYVDANGLATRLLGDSIGSNFFLVGAALQLGWLARLPGLSPASLPLAIEIAETAQLVRGFGHVKQANLERAEQQWALLQQRWSAQQAGAAPGLQQAA